MKQEKITPISNNPAVYAASPCRKRSLSARNAILMVSIALLSVFPTYESSAQSIVSNIAIISDGPKMAPRSAMAPYSSAEAATAGNPAGSPYIIELDAWSASGNEDAMSYNTRFKLPRTWDGRAVYFRIEGVSSSFSLSVNGAYCGYSQTGMNRTEFDITGFLRPDYNDLEITILAEAVTQKIESHRLRNNLSFGSAQVISQPNVRIREIIAETAVYGDRAVLSLGVVMSSRLRNPKDHVVSWELLSPQGKTVGSGQREFRSGWMNEDTLRFTSALPEVMPWSHETPHLYTLVVKNFNEGRYLEYIPFKIGFRTIAVQDSMLMVNGRSVRLHARETGCKGSEETTAAELWRLKSEGVNCVIVPGNPQPDAFYSLCDRIGLYVMNVADVNSSSQTSSMARGGNTSNDPAWLPVYLDRVAGMYHTSKIHPSIAILSPARHSANGYCLYESYLALKAADKSRPVLYMESDRQWNSDPLRIDTNGTVRSGIVFSAGSTNSGGNITAANVNSLASLEGIIIYTVKSDGRAVGSGYTEFSLAPGESAVVDIPEAMIAKVRNKGTVEVVALAEKPLYETFPDSEMAAEEINRMKIKGLSLKNSMTVVGKDTLPLYTGSR